MKFNATDGLGFLDRSGRDSVRFIGSVKNGGLSDSTKNDLLSTGRIAVGIILAATFSASADPLNIIPDFMKKPTHAVELPTKTVRSAPDMARMAMGAGY